MAASVLSSVLLLLMSGSPKTADAEGSLSDIEARIADECRPLPNGWRAQGCEIQHGAVYNVIEVWGSAIFWNSHRIDARTLNHLLLQSRTTSSFINIVIVLDDPGSLLAAEVRRAADKKFRCNVDNICVEYAQSQWRNRAGARFDRVR